MEAGWLAAGPPPPHTALWCFCSPWHMKRTNTEIGSVHVQVPGTRVKMPHPHSLEWNAIPCLLRVHTGCGYGYGVTSCIPGPLRVDGRGLGRHPLLIDLNQDLGDLRDHGLPHHQGWRAGTGVQQRGAGHAHGRAKEGEGQGRSRLC